MPDLPGEWSKALIDRTDTERFSFLASASVIWLMVDGRAFAQQKTKQYATYRAEMLVERLTDLRKCARVPRSLNHWCMRCCTVGRRGSTPLTDAAISSPGLLRKVRVSSVRLAKPMLLHEHPRSSQASKVAREMEQPSNSQFLKWHRRQTEYAMSQPTNWHRSNIMMGSPSKTPWKSHSRKRIPRTSYVSPGLTRALRGEAGTNRRYGPASRWRSQSYGSASRRNSGS